MGVIGALMALSSVLLGASAAADGTVDSAAIARSFHKALSAGNRDGVLALLDPGVVIFEQGGAEMARDEYASHHLDAELEFSRATSRKVFDQRVHIHWSSLHTERGKP